MFSGATNSGIGLLTLKSLPKEGFCFCGSIRIERTKKGKMTIFKLTSSKDRDLEFWVEGGHLRYSVSCGEM